MNEIDNIDDIANLMVELTKMIQRKLNRTTEYFSIDIEMWKNDKPVMTVWDGDFWRSSDGSIRIPLWELTTCLQQRNILFRKFRKFTHNV